MAVEPHGAKRGRWAALAALIALAVLPASAQNAVRKTEWGMTQAQVMASEDAKPVAVRESNGEVAVSYDARFADLPCRVVYFFAGGKLSRAKYLLASDHGDPNESIGDYHKVEPVLREKYGKPGAERVVWDNPAFQNESQSYLERDRATPAEIFPSDKLAGLEIALGHLKLYTQWTASGTTVLHALTGQDHRIVHQIEIRPSASGSATATP